MVHIKHTLIATIGAATGVETYKGDLKRKLEKKRGRRRVGEVLCQEVQWLSFYRFCLIFT